MGGTEIGGSSWVDGMEGGTWEDSGGTWMGGSGLSMRNGESWCSKGIEEEEVGREEEEDKVPCLGGCISC